MCIVKLILILSLLFSSGAWAKWSVSTYNIRNFDKDTQAGKTNLVELGKILQTVKSDVMAFVEVVNEKAFDELIKKELPGYEYVISSCGGFGKQKLAVAYNAKSFIYVRHEEDLGFSGDGSKCGSLRPLFLVTLKKQDTKELYIFGVAHLKAGGTEASFSQRWKQYKKLGVVAEAHSSKNLILLGDLNTTGYSIQDKDHAMFIDFLASNKLTTNSEELACTSYWAGTSGSAEYQPSILDHIVVQEHIAADVHEVKLGAHCEKVNCAPATPEELGVSFKSVSDHCPIQVSFK